MGSWLDRWLGRSAPTSRGRNTTAGDASPAPASAAVAALSAWQPPFDVDTPFVRWLLDTGPDAATHEGAEREAIDALVAAASSGRAASLVPRVPAVVPQLLQSLRDPTRSAERLARQVAQDPVLVASVLRAANSASFHPSREIASLEQALMMLGADGLRQLVASVAFRPLINVQSGRFSKSAAPRIWDQSELAGDACRILAPHANAHAFEAYLASLLQNVGHIVALRILDQVPRERALHASEAFCAAFRQATRELACDIGRQWGFPQGVTATVAPDSSPIASAPLAALVRAAERVSMLVALARAGRVPMPEARLAVASNDVVAQCFETLVAQPGPAD